MQLTKKEKQLIFVSASIAAGCQECTNFHVKKSLEMKIASQEINEVINIASQIKDDANNIVKNEGYKYLKETLINTKNQHNKTSNFNRLLCIAAAYSTNSSKLLETHLNLAVKQGIDNNSINLTFQFSDIIKEHVVSFVKKVSQTIDKPKNQVHSVNSNQCNCNLNC